MNTRILNLLEKLRNSFWPIPAVVVSLGAFAAFSFVWLDRSRHLDTFLFLGFLDPLSVSSAHVIVSTIAATMITVAGTVFSITIVVLTLATTQFGPRLLRNFMRSVANQLVLGSFIAAFVYSLIVLGSIGSIEDELFVPGLSVNCAVLLALFNVGVLIYFIHHVATSIQAESVIQNVSSELRANIKEYFPEKDKTQAPPDTGFSVNSADQSSVELHSSSHGYIQAIDLDKLRSIAIENDILISLEQSAGTHIMNGSVLLTVGEHSELSDDLVCALRESFILGGQRSSEQDVRYAFRQLVEIALRALSPGINDPFTALTCIDYLGSSVCLVLSRGNPDSYLHDEDGKPCVRLLAVSKPEIIEAAFAKIRQHGCANVAILTRLLEVIEELVPHSDDSEVIEALTEQAEHIFAAGHVSLGDQPDMKQLETQYRDLSGILLAKGNQSV